MKAEYYAKKWRVLEDGGSGTWLWVCRAGTSYVFIEIMDLVDAMGHEATSQWCGQVSIVDVAGASSQTLIDAARCCSGDDRSEWPGFDSEADRLHWACMLRDYGAKAPMWTGEAGKPREYASETSKDFRALRAEARREAEALLDDAHREAMLDSRVVNAIGQTAREYASGTEGLWTALRRIKENPEATPAQRLFVSIHGKCGDTLGAGPIPSDLRTESTGDQ